MPFKHNAARRHRIGRMKFKVTNWPEYEAGLRRRGSLTLWLTPEALAMWLAPRRTTRGGQPRYSDLAIETALTLGLVFGLRLRQVEGLLGSVLPLMGLALAVPDHTTLSRRARTWQSPNKAHDLQGRPDGASAYSCRQHWTAGLRRGPMVGGEAWRQIPPWLAKAACGGC